jgi:hypothetical protein
MWHRLIQRDDWGAITVHIGGPIVGGAYQTTLPLKKCPPILESGDYRVRWPSGFIETLSVEMRTYHTMVSDMGHDYGVTGKRPYFVLLMHGARFLVNVMDLSVEVWREDAKSP